jgi:hypothetical protein
MAGAITEYSIERLNLLASPRDFCPKCELTGEHAQVELKTPFDAY